MFPPVPQDAARDGTIDVGGGVPVQADSADTSQTSTDDGACEVRHRHKQQHICYLGRHSFGWVERIAYQICRAVPHGKVLGAAVTV